MFVLTYAIKHENVAPVGVESTQDEVMPVGVSFPASDDNDTTVDAAPADENTSSPHTNQKTHTH